MMDMPEWIDQLTRDDFEMWTDELTDDVRLAWLAFEIALAEGTDAR